MPNVLRIWQDDAERVSEVKVVKISLSKIQDSHILKIEKSRYLDNDAEKFWTLAVHSRPSVDCTARLTECSASAV